MEILIKNHVARVKKNTAKRFSGGRFVYSKAWVSARDDAVKKILESRMAVEPILGKLKVQFSFYFKQKPFKVDCSNLVEGYQDILSDFNIIQDDSQIYNLVVFKYFNAETNFVKIIIDSF